MLLVIMQLNGRRTCSVTTWIFYLYLKDLCSVFIFCYVKRLSLKDLRLVDLFTESNLVGRVG